MPVSVETVRQRLQSGEGETVEAIQASLAELAKNGLEISEEIGWVAIDVYADRNLVCHADTKSSPVPVDPDIVKDLVADECKETREHLERIVKLWVPAGRWLQDDRSESLEESKYGEYGKYGRS